MDTIHDLRDFTFNTMEGSRTNEMAQQEFVLPVLQYGPDASSSGLINQDLNSHSVLYQSLTGAVQVQHTMLSEVTNLTFLLELSSRSVKRSDDPRSIIVEPVFDSFDEQSRSVVGVFVVVETWTTYFESQSRPEQVHGFILDIVDTCGGEMIFVLNGQFAEYKGNHDIHNKKYDYLARST